MVLTLNTFVNLYIYMTNPPYSLTFCHPLARILPIPAQNEEIIKKEKRQTSQMKFNTLIIDIE